MTDRESWPCPVLRDAPGDDVKLTPKGGKVWALGAPGVVWRGAVGGLSRRRTDN